MKPIINNQKAAAKSAPFVVIAALGLICLFGVWAPAWAADEPPATLDGQFPGLAVGFLKNAVLADLPDDAWVESGDVTIRESEVATLLDQYDPKLKPQLEGDLFFLLEQEAVKRILLAEAASAGLAKEGLPDDEILQLFLSRAASQVVVTDEEILAYFEAEKEMWGGSALDRVKEPIRETLLQEKQAAAVDNYIESLGKSRQIEIDRQWAARQYSKLIENPVETACRSGIPTMVEFGASGCIPCDRMQPILNALRSKYGAGLNVPFVHVRENPVMGARYGVNTIPIQVFYDAGGREVFRHVGFFPEDRIAEVLKKMGL